MKRLLFGLILFIPFLSWSQDRELDLGAAFAFELQKELKSNWNLSLEEELRLVTNNNDVGFERNMLSIGLDYQFFDKKFKVGAYYCHIYLYNNDYYYEHRHRAYLSLSFKQDLNNEFTLTWRGRFQGTNRDENVRRYKINPKYILRNKFDLEYKIFGSPWRPSISADFSNTLNDPMGNELYRIRYQAGVNWRLNRTDSMEFFLRMDHYLVDEDPNVISLGVAYKIKL